MATATATFDMQNAHAQQNQHDTAENVKREKLDSNSVEYA